MRQTADPNFALNFAANMLESNYKTEGSWDKSIEAYNVRLGRIGSAAGLQYLAEVHNAEKTNNLNITISDPNGNKITKRFKDVSDNATTNGQLTLPSFVTG